MGKLIQVVLCAAMLTGWTSLLQAQDAVGEQRKAQAKLMMYRAARAAAIRNLAERIKGLQITSETQVKDFVAESDQISTALNATLSGMEEVGKPKYTEDGTCTVTMKVTLQEIITDLIKIRNAYYKGGKYKVEDFQKMNVTNTLKEIVETGSGAMKEEPNAPVELAVKEGEDAQALDMPANAKAYWMAHCTGQGRLMAIRAAHVDGVRRLAERIKGTLVQSNTEVKDFVTESDFINLATRQFLVGAREMSVTYHPDELIVEVQMQVKLRTVYANIDTYVKEKYKGDSAKIQKIQEITTHCEDIIVKETGMGVPPEKYLKNVQPAEAAVLNMAQQAPEWSTQTMRVTGVSAVDESNDNKAQAKLMAYRGAELDARRKIAEQLNGLVVQSKTTVADFVTQSDDIRTQMLAFQQGARVVDGTQKVAEDGTASVVVEIELAPLWSKVLEWKKVTSVKSGPGGTEVKQIEKTTVRPTAREE